MDRKVRNLSEAERIAIMEQVKTGALSPDGALDLIAAAPYTDAVRGAAGKTQPPPLGMTLFEALLLARPPPPGGDDGKERKRDSTAAAGAADTWLPPWLTLHRLQTAISTHNTQLAAAEDGRQAAERALAEATAAFALELAATRGAAQAAAEAAAAELAKSVTKAADSAAVTKAALEETASVKALLQQRQNVSEGLRKETAVASKETATFEFERDCALIQVQSLEADLKASCPHLLRFLIRLVLPAPHTRSCHSSFLSSLSSLLLFFLSFFFLSFVYSFILHLYLFVCFSFPSPSLALFIFFYFLLFSLLVSLPFFFSRLKFRS
jgi:hypothetical protein